MKNLLEDFNFIHYEINDQKVAQQLFHWLQEKSLIGASLLMNRCPGISLSSSDLIRNIFMSFFMSDTELQNKFYLGRW